MSYLSYLRLWSLLCQKSLNISISSFVVGPTFLSLWVLLPQRHRRVAPEQMILPVGCSEYWICLLKPNLSELQWLHCKIRLKIRSIWKAFLLLKGKYFSCKLHCDDTLLKISSPISILSMNAECMPTKLWFPNFTFPAVAHPVVRKLLLPILLLWLIKLPMSK